MIDIIKCKCGCGNIKPKYGSKNRLLSPYLKGHNPKSRNGFEKHNNRNYKKRCKTILSKNGKLKGRPKGMRHTEETKKLIKQKRAKQIITSKHKFNISNSLKGKNIGPKNGAWNGGTSYLPYSIEFNNKLKKFIRTRDDYKCRECNYSEKELGYTLCIHHIDYNKNNNSINNLISLCRSCHAQTNFGRNDWNNYFNNKMKEANI